MPLTLAKAPGLDSLDPLAQEVEANKPPVLNTYGPEVEKWRRQVWDQMPSQLKQRPDAATLLDKALYVIDGESGGNERAIGDSGAAWGLAQSHHIPTGSDATTQINDMWGLVSNNPDQWTDWGEGATYNGKPFGALGNKPYNGGSGAITGSALNTLPIRPQNTPTLNYSSELGDWDNKVQPLPNSTGEVSPTAIPNAQPGQETYQNINAPNIPTSGIDTQGLPVIEQPSAPNTPNLRSQLYQQRYGEQAPSAGDVSVGVPAGSTDNPLALVSGAYEKANVDIPVVSPAIRNVVKPVLENATNAYLAPLYGATKGAAALTGLPVPTPGDVASSGLGSGGVLDLAQAAAPALTELRGGRAAVEGAETAGEVARARPNLRVVQPGETPAGAMGITGGGKPDPAAFVQRARAMGMTDAEIRESFPGALEAAGGIDTGPQVTARTDVEQAAKGAAAKRTYNRVYQEYYDNLKSQGYNDAEAKQIATGLASKDARSAAAQAPEALPEQKPNVLATDETRQSMQEAQDRLRGGNAADYVYHTTSKDSLGDIAEEGLRPQRPSYRQEQDFWPKAMGGTGKEGRVYFSPSEEATSPFSGPGNVTLRINRQAVEKAGLTEEFAGSDLFTRKKVPPQFIEVKNPDGSWSRLGNAAVETSSTNPYNKPTDALTEEANRIDNGAGTSLSASDQELGKLAYGARALGDPFSEIRSLAQKQGRKLLNQAIEGESDQQKQAREEAIFRQASEDAIAKRAAEQGVRPEDLSPRDRAGATAEVLDRLQKARPGQSVEDVLTPGAATQSASEIQSARAARGGRYTPEESARLQELRTAGHGAERTQQATLEQALELSNRKTFTPPTDNPNAGQLDLGARGSQMGTSEARPTGGPLTSEPQTQYPKFDAESVAERARLSQEYAAQTGKPQMTEAEFRQAREELVTANRSGMRYPADWDIDKINAYKALEGGLARDVSGFKPPLENPNAGQLTMSGQGGQMGISEAGIGYDGPKPAEGPSLGTQRLNRGLQDTTAMAGEGSAIPPPKNPGVNAQGEFGKDFTPGPQYVESGAHRAYREVLSLLNSPVRALTYGHEPIFRQGVGFALSHPDTAKQALRNLVTVAKNPEAAAAINEALNSKPFVKAAMDSGFFHEGVRPPDTFVNRVMNKIPGMQNSAESARTYLNTLRKMGYEQEAQRLFAMGVTDSEEYHSLWNTISDVTGHGIRGQSFTVGGMSPVFSPQALMGRFRGLIDPFLEKGAFNPLAPGAKSVAIRNLIAIGGLTLGVEGIAKASGLDLKWDLLNTPLGKVEVGPSTIDPTAGYSSILRMGTRAYDAVASGDLTRLRKVPLDYLRGQLGPTVDTMVSTFTGQDWRGRDFNLLQHAQSGQLVKDLYEPIAARSIEDAVKANGSIGALIGAPSLGAMSVETNTLQTARDKGAEQLGYGKPYADLLQTQKDAVDALSSVKGEAGPPSELKQGSQDIKAKYDAQEQGAIDQFHQNKLASLPDGTSVQNMPDAWMKLGLERRAAAEQFQKEHAEVLGNIPETDYKRVTEPYFSEQNMVKAADGTIDFDATAAKRLDYINGLSDKPSGSGPSDKAIMQDALTRIEGNKSDAHQKYDRYITERKQAGYFDLKPDDPDYAKKKVALDQKNPLQDALNWYWKGGTVDTTRVPTLNSPTAVEYALQLDGKRPVKYAGLERDLNQSPQVTQAYRDYATRIQNYYTITVPKYQEQESQDLFGKPYAQLDRAQQARVASSILTQVRRGSPELEAALQFFGDTADGNGDYVVSADAAPYLRQMVSRYGNVPVNPKNKSGRPSQFLVRQ